MPQLMRKQIRQQINRWLRAPALYANRFRRRLLGIDDSWLAKPRESFAPGSWEWLALTENCYGGFKPGVSTGACRGGDRMSPFFHGYGDTYEEFLMPLMGGRESLATVLEVGILNGSGLAMWCDLFPNARVIGLDIDLTNFQMNRGALEAAGAFAANTPEVYTFDQLDSGQASRIVAEVLGSTRVDVLIDDGMHSMESIKNTLHVMLPHLARPFIYFIEDNWDTFDELAGKYPQFRWSQRGEMVVVTSA